MLGLVLGLIIVFRSIGALDSGICITVRFRGRRVRVRVRVGLDRAVGSALRVGLIRITGRFDPH